MEAKRAKKARKATNKYRATARENVIDSKDEKSAIKSVARFQYLLRHPPEFDRKWTDKLDQIVEKARANNLYVMVDLVEGPNSR